MNLPLCISESPEVPEIERTNSSASKKSSHVEVTVKTSPLVNERYKIHVIFSTSGFIIYNCAFTFTGFLCWNPFNRDSLNIYEQYKKQESFFSFPFTKDPRRRRVHPRTLQTYRDRKYLESMRKPSRFRVILKILGDGIRRGIEGTWNCLACIFPCWLQISIPNIF